VPAWWSNLSGAVKWWVSIASAVVVTGAATVVLSNAADKVEPYWYASRGFVRAHVLAQEEPRDKIVKQIYDYQRAETIERKERDLKSLTGEIRDGEVKLLEMKDPTAKQLQTQILNDRRSQHDDLEKEIKKLRDGPAALQ
jgi:hypothetical protein